jgi:hypothetical protein
MSNVMSNSLPNVEPSSAHDGRLSLRAWRRSPFGRHRKIPTNEPLKTQKPLYSQSLARAVGGGQGGATRAGLDFSKKFRRTECCKREKARAIKPLQIAHRFVSRAARK